jgi:acetyltransferase
MDPTDIQAMQLPDGSRVMIRAIRRDDASMLQAFVRRLSARSRRFRFFVALAELSAGQLERLVNVDRRRGMAVVALSERSESSAIIAEARYVLEEDSSSAEFAIAVADEFQRRGLGTQLVKKLLAYASGKGVQRLFGLIQADNQAMLTLARRLGFQIGANVSDRSTVIASILPSRVTTR